MFNIFNTIAKWFSNKFNAVKTAIKKAFSPKPTTAYAGATRHAGWRPASYVEPVVEVEEEREDIFNNGDAPQKQETQDDRPELKGFFWKKSGELTDRQEKLDKEEKDVTPTVAPVTKVDKDEDAKKAQEYADKRKAAIDAFNATAKSEAEAKREAYLRRKGKGKGNK